LLERAEVTAEFAVLLLFLSPFPVRPEKVPVLTVCEACNACSNTAGKKSLSSVYGWTMEGGFLSQNCVESLRAIKRTKEELVALPSSPQAPPLPTGFLWDRTALEARLEQAWASTPTSTDQQQTTRQTLVPPNKWVAVYGLLQSENLAAKALGIPGTSTSVTFTVIWGSPGWSPVQRLMRAAHSA